ncbi:tumor necrosis factor receptor superfamily member 5-like isoform X1 [Misgurnus anguillicaudatus]|uniref:tumor necrosis factor receptor superfamily member 5-like isoform X1 n=1 Tax=Misgurnus anguillicaudatus TaxID=75329 RepID=UPI003CCFC505
MKTTLVKLCVIIRATGNLRSNAMCSGCIVGNIERPQLLYILVTFGNACGPSEYKSSKGECCPMCNIGSVVLWECSGDSSTTCIPCSPGKFMNEPNGLYKCFACRNCSRSQGLYIQSQCNTIKDTVCDVLHGYHCVDYSNLQCQLAQKHSVCKPGQEIKTPGTKRSDTKCEDCPSGFYSPTGLNCTRWTDCAAKNEIETETGSSIKDVACTQNSRSRYGFYIAAVTFILCCMCLYLKPGITRFVPKVSPEYLCFKSVVFYTIEIRYGNLIYSF